MKEKSKSFNSPLKLCDDGKYRWTYEVSLYRNPSVFLLVWRIFFFIFIGIFAVTNIADFLNWGAERVKNNLPFLLYFLVGMTAVTALGYLIYAVIMGGKYIVEFEMDEKGINHKQIDIQAIKARKLSKATAVAGATSGRLTTAGVGLNSQRTDMYSDFSEVREVKPYPHRHLIKVNGILSHNQVYAADEDFEFIKKYIITHCDNIKKQPKGE